jgi:hypothetical protein
VLRARDDARGPEAVGPALTADPEQGASVSHGPAQCLCARPLATPERGDGDAGHARQRHDLLHCAGAAEEVAQVGLGGPPGVAKELAQGRGLPLDARVEVREVVGGQAVSVALGLPGARRPVDLGWVVEGGQHVLGEGATHPHRVAHPLPSHRVLEVPGVAGQRPARPRRGAEEGRRLAGRTELGVGALVDAGEAFS